ncbi:MAG: TonB-dependent receptor [Gammaproteobacteria bacterium]|nr:TonB-dependent receptor [Gammaproteobacteria bacterium]
MISSTGRRLTTSWWMFALLCPVGLVWAQEGGVAQGSAGSPPTAARGIVEEVVVTARRREESLQSAPLAVTAFTGEQIERLVIDDISEFSQFTPGLFAQNSPATNSGVALVIRSLSHQQNVITGDAAVGVYVDGVYVPRVQGSKFDLLDLERVEVLKGPQGTLFGRNTTGGAIQLISRAPSGNFGGNGRIALGTESFRDLSGAIEFPITDTLAGRLAASWTKRDGYGRNTLLNFDVDDKDSRSWRAYFDWNPSERVNVAFVHDGGRREESGALNQPIGVDPTGLGNFFTGGALLAAEQRAQVDPRRVRSDLDPRNLSTAFGSSVKDLSEVNDLGFALNTKISFEHFDSRTILGYRTLEVIDCEDLDGTEVEFLQGCLHLDQWNFSAEQQFLGTALDGRLDWIVGGYYFREKGKDASNFFAVIATTHQIGHVENDAASVFGQASYQLPWVNGLSLTAGVRMNFDDRKLRAEHQLPNGTCILDKDILVDPAICSATVSESFNEPTWTFGLEYRISDDQLLYLAHRRGYRTGGFTLRGQNAFQLQPVSEEIVSDVEIGLKSELFDRRLRANLAIFYADYEDIQRTIVVVSPAGDLQSLLRNAAKASIYGGEFELTAYPIPELELRSGLGVSIARYDEFIERGTGLDLSDNRFRNSPDYQINASARYTLPTRHVDRRDIGLFSFQVTYNWTSEFYMSDMNRPHLKQGAGSLWGLTADWEEMFGSRMSTSFFVKNLAGREYLAAAVDLTNIGYSTIQYAPPRTVGLSLRYDF